MEETSKEMTGRDNAIKQIIYSRRDKNRRQGYARGQK